MLPPRHEGLQINTQSSPDNTDHYRMTDYNNVSMPVMTVQTPYLGSKENLENSEIEKKMQQDLVQSHYMKASQHELFGEQLHDESSAVEQVDMTDEKQKMIGDYMSSMIQQHPL